MPDGTFKTWRELDELAGVPPGTIYTDGGTTITEQELQDILNGTYKPRGTNPKPTTPTTPKPTTPAPTTPAPTTPKPTVPTDPKNTARDSAISDMLIAALMGGGTNTVQAAQPQTNVVQAAPVFDFRNPFNVGFFDQQQDQKNNQNQRGVARIATGGYTDDLLPKEEVSVDEILRILEGR
jgi:hypothetical protein